MTNWCSVYGMVERVDWHIEECIGSWMLSPNHISALSSLSWTIGGVHLVDPFLMMWHLETRRWMIDRTREERMDGCKSTSEHNLLSRRYDFLLHLSAMSDLATFILPKPSFPSIEYLHLLYLPSHITVSKSVKWFNEESMFTCLILLLTD